MGESEELRALPEGWSWEGLAGPELAWLGEGFFGDGLLADLLCDRLPDGFSHSTWILHAQFFRPADVAPEPEDGARLPGFGFGTHAPAGWQRINWEETAADKGVPLQGPAGDDGIEIPPAYCWSALLNDSGADYVVMPPGVAPQDSLWPTEGSLGKADLEALVPVLAAHTGSTRMLGRFSPITNIFEAESIRVFSFNLATMLPSMLATGGQEFSPELWWPEDRTWVLWTDYDLMGTRVFGSKDLIDALRESADVETLDWHRVRLRAPAPPRPPSAMELRFQEVLAKQEAAEAEENEAREDDDGKG
ncbi:hypothetical protein [Pseudarthrobacter chlorophenolicus]|uniref:hypothetical protein n=1 Tax=Pseudarthrobacter chlorophenolicus TaxID=85085 RepID=UPI0005F2DE3F|nr:hypothetical protein [Pseudarthrobacter chlorophenolicus]